MPLNRTETNLLKCTSYDNCSNRFLISWSMFPNSLSTLSTKPLITLGQRRSKLASFWWDCSVEERSNEQKFWAANRLAWCAVSSGCGWWEWLWRATRFSGSWHTGNRVPLQPEMESMLLNRTRSVTCIVHIRLLITKSLLKSPLGSSRS